jgi:hypothetical protein
MTFSAIWGGARHPRRAWNGDIDRRPAVIVQCKGVADVIAAINVARDGGLPYQSGTGPTTRPATPSPTAVSWSTCR